MLSTGSVGPPGPPLEEGGGLMRNEGVKPRAACWGDELAESASPVGMQPSAAGEAELTHLSDEPDLSPGSTVSFQRGHRVCMQTYPFTIELKKSVSGDKNEYLA